MPFEVHVALFPRLATNIAVLNRMMGSVGPRGAAAYTASTATADAERQHRELLEEVCRGKTNQVNLLLW